MKLFLQGKSELEDAHGSIVLLPTRKTMLLLAALVLNQGEWLSRRALVSIVWPSADLDSGRKRLRTALSAIRKVLPSDAIDISEDEVSLHEGFVELAKATSTGPYPGDFMPGFEEDWAIDHRIELRQEAINVLLQKASSEQAAGNFEGANEALELAQDIDPLNDEVVKLRVQILEELHQPRQAMAVANVYRERAFRELGIVSELTAPPVRAEQHPLVGVTEWILARDPIQCIELLASTRSQWAGMALSPTIDIHRRALAATDKPSPARTLVEAQLVYLSSLNGDLSLESFHTLRLVEEAERSGEFVVASQLLVTLAYSSLSRGEFSAALEFATRAVVIALKTKNPSIHFEFRVQLAIVQQHVGLEEDASKTSADLVRWAEAEGTASEVASIHFRKSSDSLVQGRPDKASDALSTAVRIAHELKNDRMIPWIYITESNVHSYVGDFSRSRELLLKAQSMAKVVGGHALHASLFDHLAVAEWRLGNLDAAAMNLAQARLIRKSVGSVASVAERRTLRGVKDAVRARFDERDLRSMAASTRAQS